MSDCGSYALVVIAVIMFVWTVAAALFASKLWQLMEQMHQKLDHIAQNMETLSSRGEQLLIQLQRVSHEAQLQVETVGTIVQDVRRWVDNVEQTANVVKATAQQGIFSGIKQSGAFLQGAKVFLKFFMASRASHNVGSTEES